jgi:cystathionine beta-lyase
MRPLTCPHYEYFFLQVLIVSDEIWSDWVLPWSAHPHVPIASLQVRSDQKLVCAGAHCITLMAPTKTWNLAGLHCSYVIIQDKALRERYLGAVSHAVLHFGSAFATEALLATYAEEEDGGVSGLGGPVTNEAELWLEEAKRHVEGNMELVLDQSASLPIVLQQSPTQHLCVPLRSLAAFRSPRSSPTGGKLRKRRDWDRPAGSSAV